MRKNQVKIGSEYRAKVSGTLVTVKIEGKCSFGGWFARNLSTGRTVRIKSVQKLREEVI